MSLRRRNKALPGKFISYSLKQGCLVRVTIFKASNPYPYNPLSITLVQFFDEHQAKRIEDGLAWDCDLN